MMLTKIIMMTIYYHSHSLHSGSDPGEDHDDHDNHDNHIHHPLHTGYVMILGIIMMTMVTMIIMMTMLIEMDDHIHRGLKFDMIFRMIIMKIFITRTTTLLSQCLLLVLTLYWDGIFYRADWKCLILTTDERVGWSLHSTLSTAVSWCWLNCTLYNLE